MKRAPGPSLRDALLAQLADSIEPRDEVPTDDLLEWGRALCPEYLYLAPSAMHRFLAERLVRAQQERAQRIAILGPRGNAKSTWATLLYVAWCALEGLEPYILIISDVAPQARQHLGNVAAILQTATIQDAYPDVHIVSGAGERIQLSNGVVIECLSTGQKLRGRRHGHYRPSLVILDDPENDEGARSPSQRNATWQWFVSALLKAGDPNTNFIVLGTNLHQECLVARLLKEPGWEAHKFQSIVDWPTDLDLWEEWENVYCNLDNENHLADARAFYDSRRKAMDAGAAVLWPEWESLYDLMKMRVDDGRTSFEREKQNNPHDPEACEWPEEYFGPHIWFDQWPRNLDYKIMSLDPSKGTDSKLGDYAPITLLGLKGGYLYVDCDMRRRMAHESVEELIDYAYRWKPHGVAIETNQFQQLLAVDFQRACDGRKFYPAIHELVNTVSKPVRIRRIGPYLSQRRVRFKRGSAGAKLLVEQLQQFPTADHDDGPDGLEMAIRVGAQLSLDYTDDEGHLFRAVH